MILFKLFISIFLITNLVAQDQVALEEYKIELIIFKNVDINTTETFDNLLILPKENVLSFYEPELLINTTDLFFIHMSGFVIHDDIIKKGTS